MGVKSMGNASKPVTLGAYYFRMFQMVSEQERLVSQKEALWKRQKSIQNELDYLEKEVHRFEQQLKPKRELLMRRNLKSYCGRRNKYE